MKRFLLACALAATWLVSDALAQTTFPALRPLAEWQRGPANATARAPNDGGTNASPAPALPVPQPLAATRVSAPLLPVPMPSRQLTDSEAKRIVDEAYREVVLLGGTHIAMLRKSVDRAAFYADKAGLAALAAELRAMRNLVPQPVQCFGHEREATSAAFFRAKAAELRKLAETAAGEKKEALIHGAEMLERAATFYLKVGHSKADACFLEELFCRILGVPPCYTPCEILVAERLRDASCAGHGDMLYEWMPVLSKVHAKWTKEKAMQLGGSSDFDHEACTVWLAEMKPLFQAVLSAEDLQSLYADPARRTRIWIMARRGLTCASERFYGTETRILKPQWDQILTAAGAEVEQNRQSLAQQMEVIHPKCTRALRFMVPEVGPPVRNGVPTPAPRRAPCGCT